MKVVDRRHFLATSLGTAGFAFGGLAARGEKPAPPAKGTPSPDRPLLARQPGEDDASFGRKLLAVEFLPPAQRKLALLFHHAYPGKLEGFQILDGVTRVGFRTLHGEISDLIFEDGKAKTFEQREETPDLADTLHDSYPDRLSQGSWPENFDPGRYRLDGFLKSIYGASESEVAAQLVTVDFCGHKVRFNKNNRAADALNAAGTELEALKGKIPAIRPYLAELGGTFTWRPIAGTQRLSAHSYAIAIDLNPELGGYWRWEKNGNPSDMDRRRKYPEEIVRVFEKHGFVWGGKWYHFDLMHFEYRPEFFA